MNHPCQRGADRTPCGNTATCRLCWLFAHDDRYRRLWGGEGPATPGVWSPGAAEAKPCGPRLGDVAEQALSAVGITAERVEAWLGKCRCKERRERLNALGEWAASWLRGEKQEPPPLP